MVSELINANPIVYEKKECRAWSVPIAVEEYAVEPIDQQEVFDILSLQLFWYGLCTFKSTYYRGISKVVFRELGLDGHNFFFFAFWVVLSLLWELVPLLLTWKWNERNNTWFLTLSHTCTPTLMHVGANK